MNCDNVPRTGLPREVHTGMALSTSPPGVIPHMKTRFTQVSTLGTRLATFVSIFALVGCVASSADNLPRAAVDGGALRTETEAHPAQNVTAESLHALWGSARDDVWAAGEAGTILHFDGERWTAMNSHSVRNLLSITGSGRADVWAVGEDVVLHFDGSTWTEVLTDMDELLLSSWSAGPNDVWAAGLATDVDLGIVRHWNGADWEVAIATSARTLWRIWGTEAGDMWTGGTSSGGAGFLAHGDAGRFGKLAYDGASPRAIWGTGSDDVWIVPYEGDLEHWNGTSFRSVPGRSAMTLLGMHGTSSLDVWSVGLAGTIQHWDGATWSRSAANTDASLFGIWASATDDAWAAGGDGTLVHWNGATWQPPAAR
jgi:hypothetical protein